MKSFGVIRKIDELGRIVIPKEIRTSLDIRTDDYLQIEVNGNDILLKKYSPLFNNKNFCNRIIKSVQGITKSTIYISDQENIITYGDLEEKSIPSSFHNFIIERQEYESTSVETFNFNTINKKGFFLIKPIIQDSSSNGLVILFSENNIIQSDKLIVEIIKNIIEK